jgi:hypothetical protein
MVRLRSREQTGSFRRLSEEELKWFRAVTFSARKEHLGLKLDVHRLPLAWCRPIRLRAFPQS